VKLSEKKPHKDDDKSWIFILLILLGVAFVLFSQNSGDGPGKTLVNDPEHMKRVDNHLKDTAFNLEADRRQRQIEVYQELNKLRNQNKEAVYQDTQEFSLDSDPYMQSLTQELNRSRQAPDDQATPEQIVQQKLYENYQLQKASEAYREAYAEQFKENARKGGWDIELGPNFEVLSVKKIETKRHPSLFQDGETGSAR
jgi:hypothetical protein